MSKPAGASEQKIVWPLFVVAGLSFIPFLGLFIGCAGATWGLISSRRKAIWAAVISLAGALANIVLIVVIGASVGGDPAVASVARRRVTQAELARIVGALEEVHASQHAYPASLRVLQQRMMLQGRIIPIIDNSAGSFHLPRAYQYTLAPDGESYDLVAAGPDKVFGTADDIRPVLSDSLKAHSGYRPPEPGTKP